MKLFFVRMSANGSKVVQMGMRTLNFTQELSGCQLIKIWKQLQTSVKCLSEIVE
jgi:hypothetical protein